MGIYQLTSSRAGTLNVLLHGTFTYYREPNNIRIFVPLLDNHVYLAGNWLGETRFLPGDYTVDGVKNMGKNFAPLDQSRNLIVTPAGPVPAPGVRLHATLQLGYPRKITSLRVAPVSRQSFQPLAVQQRDLAGNVGNDLSVATLQILTYEIADENRLCLCSASGHGGHFWEPVFCGDYVNLHIFSEEDHQDSPSFADDDLVAAMQVLGSQVTSVNLGPTAGIEPDVPLPAGVCDEETEGLARRCRRIARLGRLVRQKGDPNQAWYRNDVLGSDPPACGGPWS